MTREEVKDMFKDTEKRYSRVSDINIADIWKEFGSIEMKFDRKTMDTLYYVRLMEEMDDEIVNEMYDEGWSLGDDGKSLVIYINV